MSESIGRDAAPTQPQGKPGPTPADAPTAAAPADAGHATGNDGPAELERRQFVRQMTTDAVGFAGRLVGFSRVITRSATAAGQAMMSELGSIQAAGTDPDVEHAGDAPVAERLDDTAKPTADAAETGAGPARGASGDAAAPVDPPAAAPPGPPAPVSREEVWPRVVLDAEQSAVLTAATRAIVAVNRRGFAPQLTAATILWDGEVIRFPTLGWSRRTTQLRADSKIGLLIDDPAAGVFLAVSGTARILEAHHVRAAMEPLLRREAPDPDDAERRWQAMLADDRDRAVIVVELDQVLTGRR